MSGNTIPLLGLDFATQERNRAIVAGRFDPTSASATLDHVEGFGTDGPGIGQPRTSLDWVGNWLKSHHPALLAFDAPLGWPTLLATTLTHHHAGRPLLPASHTEDLSSMLTRLFTRETDRAIRVVVGKTPLEVGADRIARMAAAALDFAERLRQRTGIALPLLWSEEDVQRESVMAEVYPAATLALAANKSGLSVRGYKQELSVRKPLLEVLQLSYRLDINGLHDSLLASQHRFDALLAFCAGLDILQGRCLLPPAANNPDSDIVLREGWIWCRDPHCS